MTSVSQAFLHQVPSSLFVDCTIATLTIYEHLITLGEEIRVIWCHKFTGATLLFLVNRYLTLLTASLVLATLTTVDGCSNTRGAVTVVVICLSLTFLVFATLRTYAIAGRNCLLWAIPVFFLTLVPIPISIFYWTVSLDIYHHKPLLCIRLINVSSKRVAIGSALLNVSFAWDDAANIAVIAELASRGALVSANLIMLILVLRRTFFLYLQSRKSQIRTPLLRTLLQNGAIFFLTFLVLNLLTLFAEFTPALSPISPAGALPQDLVPILTSRFMLNLRQASEYDDSDDIAFDAGRGHLTSDQSTLGFRIPQSVIGNLGEGFVDESEVDVETNELEAIAAVPSFTERAECMVSA